MPPSKGNTNNWVLCPSTSFPGKFYYFNVESGETAWSNDNKPNTKNIYNPNITNHHYPEPCTIPPNYPNATAQSNPKITINQPVKTPAFGQATFIKYVPTIGPYMPNMLWSLVPMPMMINTPLFSSDNEKQMLNHATQTSTERTTVHACKVPLSERFAANTVTNTQWELNTNSDEIDEFDDNSNREINLNSKEESWDCNVRWKYPSYIHNDTINFDHQSTPNKEIYGPHQRIRTESDSTINNNNPNPLYKLKSQSLESLITDKHDSTTSHALKAQNGISTNQSSRKISGGSRISATDFEPAQVLDQNDLRYKLVAKRRKSVDIGSLENRINSPTAIGKHSESKHNEDDEKVDEINTCNISNGGSCQMDENNMTLPTQNLIETLRNMANQNVKSVWYIITDKDALLEHCDMIEEFVRQDKNCRMVIPFDVVSQIKQIGQGDSRGRQLAIAARQVIRHIATAPAHVIVQPNDNLDFEISSCDKIIQCCMQAMSQRFHVVLVTNDEELTKKSKCNDIHTITVKEIQNGRLLDDSFEQIKKIQISVENKTAGNLFMQSPSLFESSLNFENRTDIPVNCFKRNLFETKIVDTSTSSIDFVEMKNITQTKRNDSFSNDNDMNKTASEISQGIDQRNSLNKEHEVQRSFDFQNEIENPCQFNVASTMKSKSLKASIDKELKIIFMNGFPEERLAGRIDEFFCIFTQIMEEALFEVINVSQISNMVGIWSLHEAVLRIGDIYKCHPGIKSYVEKLSTSLERWGKSKHKSLIVNEFFKMFRCGVLFLEELAILFPNVESLTDAIRTLLDLVKRIQDPENDEILYLETPSAQINRSELESFQPRHNYIKKTADIIKYLKQNFPAWKSFDENEIATSKNNNTNIIRTTGANINKLTLHAKKASNTKTQNHSNTQETEKLSRVKNALKKSNNKNAIEQHSTYDKFETNLSHEKTSNYDKFRTNKNDEKTVKEHKVTRLFCNIENGPKVIRNVKLLNAYEDRMKKESESSRDSGIIHEEVSVLNVNSLGSKDSCFGSGSEEACCFARTFLFKISLTLKEIYQFAQHTIKDIRRSGGLNGKSNNAILNKTNGVLVELNNIIELLECIAERESHQRTEFKSLVLQNADSVCDKRLTNYGKVVAKCLEQASIMRHVLNIVSSMNDNVTDITHTVTTNMSYINIFE